MKLWDLLLAVSGCISGWGSIVNQFREPPKVLQACNLLKLHGFKFPGFRVCLPGCLPGVQYAASNFRSFD